jgi:recombinational DNA repair ATPase RecF
VAEFLHQETSQPPLLLLDDIFGELDPSRRDALLHGIPAGSQAFLSTTDLSGITLPSGAATQILHQGILTS